MSKNPYPIFSIAKNEDPQQIEGRIGLLVRLYLINQHSMIAQAVADHVNAVLAHPGFVNTIEQRCIYLRLAAHWRCLAWINNQENKKVINFPKNIVHCKDKFGCNLS